MKIALLNLEGEKVGTINLPKQFEEEYRPDIIKKAVLVIQSRNRQPYGAYVEAGKRYSAEISKRRRKYRGCYGKGISRVPRKIMTRRGMHFFWVGAFAPGTVGGRRAHPPKAEKDWEEHINTKERRKALRSALAASAIKALVQNRGHKVEKVEFLPIVVEAKIEDLKKTKEAIAVFKKLKLGEELERISQRSIRAGKGKNRGRKYKNKKGPLIVVSKKCKLMEAARNLHGTDIVAVESLNTELLAPGCDAGRLCIFTDKALKLMEEKDLFTNIQKNVKGVSNK
ncbi:50S ribosomal protein L4 [Candidatus Woesearchaeota archaeon]|nr:50S ribosomal protein L4 [Candidatus Woesearchaeota archaeon]